ncbi:hypothetical protein RxyAA322_25740 [Rubrobacter xylanophilus]|uniref:Uncharacterized protein n=1 Tax=Rubrobacter xylanophilus TaxID=49319 RepID=A0A510HL20_9ACTN|nr:hypothetical protein [Rubrobacter xylanophilus]BBL80720.1 hypothetical protein RxyAA322_25740 [Rubrobacter xylanophilus]
MAESREAPERDAREQYTVVGVLDDGANLNRAVKEIRDLGVDPDDITVILKRQDPSEPEPFPEGTRYIVVPGDRRGLEVPVGFGVVFIIVGIFFAITTPAIGIPALFVFVSLAAILFAGAFSRVGLTPILTDMEAPREEAGAWDDEFEMGKVLVFVNTTGRRLLRPIREVLEGSGATYYLVDRHLRPRALHQASMYRAGGRKKMEGSVSNHTGSV